MSLCYRLKVNYYVVLKYTHDDAALLGHQLLSCWFMFETFIVAFMCFRLFHKINDAASGGYIMTFDLLVKLILYSTVA